MRSKQLLLSAVLLAQFSAASAALYITDNISVGVFATPDLQGEPELRLTSGMAVDVIESRGAVRKIRTEHGEQGWLKASFLIKTPPLTQKLEESRQALAQLESALESLQEENASLKKFSAEAKGVTVLRGELERVRKQNETLTAQLAAQPKSVAAAPVSIDDQVSELQAQLETIKGEKSDMEQRLAAAVLIGGGSAADFEGAHEPSISDIQVTLPGVIVVLIIGLLVGGGVSYRWLDRRLTKRFGGIKLH
jgi:SH3 domain protein